MVAACAGVKKRDKRKAALSWTIKHSHKCKKCRHVYSCPTMYCVNSFYNGKCKKCSA